MVSFNVCHVSHDLFFEIYQASQPASQHSFTFVLLYSLSVYENISKPASQPEKAKYDKERLANGRSSSCIPIVFEHFGHWGGKASEYLNVLAGLSRDDEGRKNPAEFRDLWRKRFSVLIQTWNARVILNKTKRLSFESSCSNAIFSDGKNIQNAIH